MKPTKTMTLLIGTKTAGACLGCRHANQGTADFAEGHVFCGLTQQARRADARCDVSRPLPVRAPVDPKDLRPYYLFERYDGRNCTFGRLQDQAIVAEDASHELAAFLRREVAGR